MKSDIDSGQNNKKALITRARMVAVVLFVFAVMVFFKLLHVQYYASHKGKTWSEYAVKNDLKLDTIRAMRGSIFSNDGSLLATSLPYYYVGFDTKVADSAYFYNNVDQLASLLGRQGQRWDAQRGALGHMVTVGFQHHFSPVAF